MIGMFSFDGRNRGSERRIHVPDDHDRVWMLLRKQGLKGYQGSTSLDGLGPGTHIQKPSWRGHRHPVEREPRIRRRQNASARGNP